MKQAHIHFWPLAVFYLPFHLINLIALSVHDVQMSFGFDVAVVKLANNIQKEFTEAPAQFKAIRQEWVQLFLYLPSPWC
jgi:hypothetical protein